MKLAFYGGGYEEESLLLDKVVLKLTGKSRPRITYIPSCSYDGEIHYRQFVEHYLGLGIVKFTYFPVDIPFDQTLLRQVLNSDVIHLSGGNTYYFLKYLRKSGMLAHLRHFVKNGGVLTGVSAGGIVMTPKITTASYPFFDKDDNDENIKNLDSLNLVNFEFFPHYKNSKRYDVELIKASRKLDYPIYASADGSGVIVDGAQVKFIGRNYSFYRGDKTKLS